MKQNARNGAVVALLLLLTGIAHAQIDDICREAGIVPSLDSPFNNVPYIYGRVRLNGAEIPRTSNVTVIFSDREQQDTRWKVGKSGSYCFRRNDASGGLLVVEVDGAEAARRALPSFGPNQQREDFNVMPPEAQRSTAPASVNAKFARPPNERTLPIYQKVAEAKNNKQLPEAVKLLKEIVLLDPLDYVAWAELGTVYFGMNALPDADSAFRKALEIRVDYTPVWVNVGKLRTAQKQYGAASEIFKHALTLEPSSARIYQLLGENYLQAKQGSLGADALKKAIELDPVGMAECHLLLAALYDRAGAKDLAAGEYKLFLAKVPDHPDRKKFEKYIKANPE